MDFSKPWLCQYYCKDSPHERQKNAWRKGERFKYVTSCFEQILEAASNKRAVARPLTSYLKNHQRRHAGYCWRSKNKLIKDVHIWTPSHWCTGVVRPARTWICSGYFLGNLPWAMEDRTNEEREIHSDNTARWWWRWWWWLRKTLF